MYKLPAGRVIRTVHNVIWLVVGLLQELKPTTHIQQPGTTTTAFSPSKELLINQPVILPAIRLNKYPALIYSPWTSPAAPGASKYFISHPWPWWAYISTRSTNATGAGQHQPYHRRVLRVILISWREYFRINDKSFASLDPLLNDSLYLSVVWRSTFHIQAGPG